MKFGDEFAVDRLTGYLDQSRADALAAATTANGDGVERIVNEYADTEDRSVGDGDQYCSCCDTLVDLSDIDRQRRGVEHPHHDGEFVGCGTTDRY